jgi:hypothetical protein
MWLYQTKKLCMAKKQLTVPRDKPWMGRKLPWITSWSTFWEYAIRQLHFRGNITKCTSYLDGIAYYTPKHIREGLLLSGSKPVQYGTVLDNIGNYNSGICVSKHIETEKKCFKIWYKR